MYENSRFLKNRFTFCGVNINLGQQWAPPAYYHLTPIASKGKHCTTCEPVSMNVATAPTDQIEQIPLYPRLSDTEIETENLWLLKMKNKPNNILYN